MSGQSAIQWTDATWNPVTGCSKVSPGCANCYAETMALTRLRGKPGYPGLPWTPENAATNVTLRPDKLDDPLSWREPRRVFVNSMSDLFHELVPIEFLAEVFNTMMAASPDCGRRHRHDDECYGLPNIHTFQVLTKRPERMRDVIAELPSWTAENFDPSSALCVGMEIGDWPPKNVWLGTSIENDRWTGRADVLRAVPGDWTRFLSCEPLLGPLPSLDLTDIDWVIVGGESGRNARPMNEQWVRDIVAACREHGAAPFVKQMGSVWSQQHLGRRGHAGEIDDFPEDLRVREYPGRRA